ncbi:MAG: methyltransferase domain-containing protein [Acidimicrobiales bacterium]
MSDAPAQAVTELDDAADARRPEPFAGPDHPMRRVTRQVAFEGGWSPERAAKVGALFDSMAADWSADHVDEVKAAPLRDALDRGGLDPRGRWLELGCGTGAGALVLHPTVADLTAVDLSAEMLAHAPDVAPRVRADAAALPFATAAFDTVVMVNMLLFPGEVDRVLGAGGAVVWVNTLGDQTPIHLPPHDVVAALPGPWSGVTARAGTGFWAVLRRRSP